MAKVKKSFKENMKDYFLLLVDTLKKAIQLWIENKKEENKIIREAVRKEKIRLKIEHKKAHLRNIYSAKQNIFSNSNKSQSLFSEERKKDERWLN